MKFAKEDDTKVVKSTHPWKILIVDDEEEVHQITKVVLSKFEFENQRIETISAYSGDEAIEILKNNSDIALILLDVVMESDDAGLIAVKRIRHELKNSLVRIILRTGQPGSAPEHDVIRDYDINDYKEKTELTADKLYTVVISSLRSYRDISIIEQNRLGLKSIIESSSTIFQMQSFKYFAHGVLTQLLSLMSIHSNEIKKNAFSAIKKGDSYEILAVSGDFENKDVSEIVSDEIDHLFQEAIETKHHINEHNNHVYYFETQNGTSAIFYYVGDEALNDVDQSLVDIFSVNVSIAFENITLNQEIHDRQKAKLNQMGEIISMIAHQWRQPLSSISAITTNFKLSMALGEEINLAELEEGLSNIEERTELLSQTIDDFRNFYKPDNIKTSFYIDELIQQSINILEATIKEVQIKIFFEVDNNKKIFTHKSELFQVLINIIKNAIEALSDVEIPRKITIKSYTQKNYYFIEIEDNAGGVAPNIIHKIFDPYFSTKTQRNGTGLGLYMSKLIIEDHCSGELNISNTTAGAKFSIKLPHNSVEE